MINVFISIVIGLIIINITYSILPDTGYNKYLKVIVGIILLLFVVNSVTDIELKNSFYEFEEERAITENKEYRDTVNKQLEESINEEIEKSIMNKFEISVTVNAKVDKNQLDKIEIITKGKCDEGEIKRHLSDTYKIESGRIIIK